MALLPFASAEKDWIRAPNSTSCLRSEQLQVAQGWPWTRGGSVSRRIVSSSERVGQYSNLGRCHLPQDLSYCLCHRTGRIARLRSVDAAVTADCCPLLGAAPCTKAEVMAEAISLDKEEPTPANRAGGILVWATSGGACSVRMGLRGTMGGRHSGYALILT